MTSNIDKLLKSNDLDVVFRTDPNVRKIICLGYLDQVPDMLIFEWEKIYGEEYSELRYAKERIPRLEKIEKVLEDLEKPKYELANELSLLLDLIYQEDPMFMVPDLPPAPVNVRSHGIGQDYKLQINVKLPYYDADPELIKAASELLEILRFIPQHKDIVDRAHRYGFP